MNRFKNIIAGVGLVTAAVCSADTTAEKKPNVIFLFFALNHQAFLLSFFSSKNP